MRSRVTHSACSVHDTPGFHQHSVFFFEGYGDHRDLHSFPTRRSSDLGRRPDLADAARSFRGEKHARQSEARVLQIRSEEHTSELQSLAYLVCRLLLEKKKAPPRCTASATPMEPTRRSPATSVATIAGT